MDVSYYFINLWRTPSPTVKVSSLEHINLSNNFASVVEDGFFAVFPNPVTLDASNNFLGTELAKDTRGLIFKTLRHLTALDLSGNKLSRLPDKIFSSLDSFSTLNLAFNSIGKIRSSLAEICQI